MYCIYSMMVYIEPISWLLNRMNIKLLKLDCIINYKLYK